ncbi:adenylate/guanylate cyclase domain-containing protein [Desulfurobacterium atlanticum]|uniref:Adenylate cyclase n=1 Tax=Desulfurobacterium atlanticum TaxID=240169 RepID=A0A238YMI9_9BACT|nr:adenylate/guanylate cyclase domain-containing protein [Desulfurobacterium atlanticum]SNR72347.1 adenylate cyclase [Desulfurobacterium atlanticum]
MSLKKELLPVLILFCLSAFITGAVFFFKISPFYEFALKTGDVFYSFNKNKPSDDITLILVDEKSVNRFGRWPWNRKIVADGIRKLKGAKVVGLDMVFSETTDEENDRKLSEAVASNGNVVCGFFLRPEASENPDDEILDTLSDSALLNVPDVIDAGVFKYVEANILSITESCFLSGTLNVLSDRDKIIRHYQPVFIFNGEVYPSLGLQVLRVYYGKDAVISKEGVISIGDRKVAFDREGVLLNFYKFENYRENVYSFVDLYDGKVPPDRINGKIVLLGISEAGITDIKPSPIGFIPGTYFHLTFISNFVNGDFVFPDIKIDVALSVIFALLILFLFFYVGSVYLRFFLYGLVGIAVFLISIFLYVLKISFPWLFFIYLFLFLSVFFIEIYSIASKTREARFIKSMFGTYVSRELLEIMVKHPERLKLGGEKRDITVLFADIRNFTSLSEKMEPEKLVELINFIFTPLTEIILNSKGTLDKYIGDAIMAVWNAPISVKNHPEMAVLAAYRMLKEMKRLNKDLRRRGFPEIGIGIGINSGKAVVGNMGSKKRFDYTAMGDTVNLASRLEGLNKVYRTQVLVSQFTRFRVDEDKFPFRFVEIDSVRVKGKEHPVRIFTFLDRDGSEEIKEFYEKALSLYRMGRFKEALAIFEKVADFPPAGIMIERCKNFMVSPPENWEGVVTYYKK